MAENTLIYSVDELNKTYLTGGVTIKALDSVSFTVSEGDMLAVMGRSGSGKSTLLRQMGLLDRPTSGSVIFEGEEMTRLPEGDRTKLRLKSMGYVFQEYALLGELTAHQNVYLPGMMLGKNGCDYKRRALELLELVGLAERTGHYPKELSGGEQQRVSIARALINSPSVLLADEPCANLDTISSKLVMETLVRLNSQLKVTIVFISHDPGDKRYACSLIVLSDGRIIEESQA
ncbi:MAG: ABC transporter ATP-binding protein [Chloroflexi bacterium]|nr:ABC transporter ATP-binding protein [Chloroflexota bacterium]